MTHLCPSGAVTAPSLVAVPQLVCPWVPHQPAPDFGYSPQEAGGCLFTPTERTVTSGDTLRGWLLRNSSEWVRASPSSLSPLAGHASHAILGGPGGGGATPEPPPGFPCPSWGAVAMCSPWGLCARVSLRDKHWSDLGVWGEWGQEGVSGVAGGRRTDGQAGGHPERQMERRRDRWMKGIGDMITEAEGWVDGLTEDWRDGGRGWTEEGQTGVGGWMDRWMDGGVHRGLDEGQRDGQIDVWGDGHRDGCVERPVSGQDSGVDGQRHEWMNR